MMILSPANADKDLSASPMVELEKDSPSLCSTSSEETQSCTTRRSLTFSSSLEAIQPTIHRADYAPEEKAATWYCAKDIKHFRRERREIVRQMEEGNQEVDTCIRGIEHLTKLGSVQRFEAITAGLAAVLEDLDGKENYDMLAHIYRFQTMHSKAVAYERGLQDQREILDSPVNRFEFI